MLNTVEGLENARKKKQYDYMNRNMEALLIIQYLQDITVTYNTIEIGTLGYFTMDSLRKAFNIKIKYLNQNNAQNLSY